MKTTQQIRTLCAQRGIVDDAAERLIMEINEQCRVEIELERARVPNRVWVLEDQLLEAKANGYVE